MILIPEVTPSVVVMQWILISGKTSVASRLIFSSNDIGRKAGEFLCFILKCI